MKNSIESSGGFWSEWAQKIADSAPTYIRPDHTQVDQIAGEVESCRTRYKTAKNVWKTVHNRTEYKESSRWQTPNKTVNKKTGDCDDQTFLQTSILANLGIPCSICGGTLTFPNGTTEHHVWNEVDGRIVDATAQPHRTSHLTYRTYARVDILPTCQR